MFKKKKLKTLTRHYNVKHECNRSGSIRFYGYIISYKFTYCSEYRATTEIQTVYPKLFENTWGKERKKKIILCAIRITQSNVIELDLAVLHVKYIDSLNSFSTFVPAI